MARAWLGAAAASLAVAGCRPRSRPAPPGGRSLSGPGRKFALAFAPTVLAGAVLTVALVRAGACAGASRAVAAACTAPRCRRRRLLRAGRARSMGWRSSRSAWPPRFCRPPGGTRCMIVGFGAAARGLRPADREAARWLSDAARRKRGRRAYRRSARKLRRRARRPRGPGGRPSSTAHPPSPAAGHRQRAGGCDSLPSTSSRRCWSTTDGNLSVHARKLEEAQYMTCTKTFEGRRPRTEYRLTAQGRRELAAVPRSHGGAHPRDARHPRTAELRLFF